MSLFRLYKRFRPIDWLFLLVIAGLTVLQVWTTMLMTDKIRDLTSGITLADSNTIWQAAYLYILFALANFGCQAGNAILASAITAHFAVKVRKEIYEKVSSFSLAELSQFSTASLITRTTNDLEQVQMSSLLAFRMCMAAPITAIWAIVKIRASSTELTWVTVAGVLVIALALVIVFIFVAPKFKIVQKLIDRLNLVTRESINGVRVVRAYNAEEYQEEKFKTANDNLMKLNLFTSRLMSLFSPIIAVVLDAITIGIYFIGAGLINGFANPLQRMETYSTVIAFSTLAVQVVMSFMMLLFLFIMMPRAMVAAKRICEVLDSKPNIVDPEHAEIPNEVGTLCFENVAFTYPGAEKPIIENVNFAAKRGQTVAVIGATGSGKTTLINLISRLYDATEGSVKIDGVDVKNLKQSDLRSRIGFVPQKGLLFSGTVASNIGFGLENPSQEIIEEAATVACADEFIEHLDGQYNGPIAQGGTNVSGGQRQRLCIARACAIHPEIFVFDDSFSALDFKTDRKVRSNLKKAYPDATKVIVAQRVGTVIDADLILVLDGGKVVGQGTHKELLKNCEVYRNIALSQLSKEELGL